MQPTKDQVEASAKAIYFVMHSVMHDHEKIWRDLERKWLYREAAEAALKATVKD